MRRPSAPASAPRSDVRTDGLAWILLRRIALGLLAPAAFAQAPVALAPEVVTATRLPQPPEHAASTVRVLDERALQSTPTLTLDGALRTLPSFSLFRRSDSLIANPSSQGVSLRGLGPSGASRSLVLLDGVPLNDPFGGWVAWSKVPRLNLLRIEVVPGGGASAWGSAVLGGVVQVLGQNRSAQATSATATAGDFGTRSIEFAHTQSAGAPASRSSAAGGTLDLAGRVFSTDGIPLVAPERRGPIDLAAWSRHRWISARWRQSLGDTLHVAATVRGYEEKRGNGTPYQRNGTREKFLSLTLAGQPAPAFAWSAIGYAQDQWYSSTFSSVNATRTAETPASDQFAVPATALGGAWTGTWRHASDARTSLGADTRFVRGETREHFQAVAGNFARLRVAGGRQLTAGIFALHDRPLLAQVRATVGARVDRLQESDGHRRESDRATGVVSRHDRYADRTANTVSPSAGLVWRPAAAWRLRASFQRAHRHPTLNELYRPFRVGANITEANAALRTERVNSGEVGAEWSSTAPALGFSPAASALPRLSLGATLFANDLRDAVANVTLVRGPGTFPGFGTIGAGGSGRQKLNLDRIRVQGIELSARWSPAEALSITAEYLRNQATVRRATAAPALVGRRVAQVPRDGASLGATWRAPGLILLAPRVRYLGRQFEDDENQLVLGATVVADLGLSRPLTRHLELFLTAENLGNARLEIGRSADGLVNVGPPRLVVGGLRGTW